MPTFNSKHGKREQTFSINSFSDGLNQEIAPLHLSLSGLTRCKNLKYAAVSTNRVAQSGKQISAVILKKRQGTEIITATALSSAMKACTYYAAHSQYIVATSSNVYYLNSSYVPVLIGAISGTPTFTEFHGKLIIHDSGVTKAWDGTTFETLNCLYTDEVIETGNNSTTEFTGTLAHPVVKTSSLTITFTDTTSKTIIDDGNGRMTGNVATAAVKNIIGATSGNPCMITALAHGFTDGDLINIQSVSDMTQINNTLFTVANATTNTFTIGVDSTGYGAYTTGGTVSCNTVNYTTGAYQFTCDGAPDNTTSVKATYEKVAGAPKSKVGFVRASSLYVYGDSDNPSRLYYTAVNDEDAWDDSSDGGYLDVDPQDGYDLIGCLNFFQSLIAIKENSLHRIDNFPGDTTFDVQPLLTGIGSVACQTCINDSSLISFLSKEGWLGLSSTQEYGDIAKTANLSKNFDSQAIRYANSLAYSEYNQIDKQLWITLFAGTTQIPIVYVVNMETGGQLSLYEFAFDHTCYKFVNNEMLIGGADGHLYRLYDKHSRYKDNGVSYSPDTYVSGPMTNFEAPFNRKHNKRIFPHVYGTVGMTGTLNIYTNVNYVDAIYTTTVTSPWGQCVPFNDLQDVLAYDLGEVSAGATRTEVLHKKFNYHELQFELTNIGGAAGSEIYGLDFDGAVIGE